MNSRFLALGIAAALALAGCATAGDEFTKQELSDEMPSVISLASETELFTGFVTSGRSRAHFSREHAAYLLDGVKDELKKLQKKPPSQAVKSSYNECGTDLLLLQSLLKHISEGAPESDIRQIHSQAHAIHERLRSAAAKL